MLLMHIWSFESSSTIKLSGAVGTTAVGTTSDVRVALLALLEGGWRLDEVGAGWRRLDEVGARVDNLRSFRLLYASAFSTLSRYSLRVALCSTDHLGRVLISGSSGSPSSRSLLSLPGLPVEQNALARDLRGGAGGRDVVTGGSNNKN